MDYDEIRKELKEETHLLHFTESEVVDAEDDLAEAEGSVKAHKKQIKALRQILRAADEPYGIEKLEGVG